MMISRVSSMQTVKCIINNKVYVGVLAHTWACELGSTKDKMRRGNNHIMVSQRCQEVPPILKNVAFPDVVTDFCATVSRLRVWCFRIGCGCQWVPPTRQGLPTWSEWRMSYFLPSCFLHWNILAMILTKRKRQEAIYIWVLAWRPGITSQCLWTKRIQILRVFSKDGFYFVTFLNWH